MPLNAYLSCRWPNQIPGKVLVFLGEVIKGAAEGLYFLLQQLDLEEKKLQPDLESKE